MPKGGARFKLTSEEVERRLAATKLCEFCNNPMKEWNYVPSPGKFSSWGRNGPYCSYSCARKNTASKKSFDKTTITKPCKCCSTQFPAYIFQKTRNQWAKNPAIFCSRVCGGLHRWNSHDLECQIFRHIHVPRLENLTRNHSISTNKSITLFGETKLAADWLRDPRCAITRHSNLISRINKGWSVEKALLTPSAKGPGEILVTLFNETKSIQAWASDSRCEVGIHSLSYRHNKLGWSWEKSILTPRRKAGSPPSSLPTKWEQREKKRLEKEQHVKEQREQVEALGVSLAQQMQELYT
jgi:hypothetical protein